MANGSIAPSRAVKYDTTAGAEGKVIQCGAGERAIGISQPGVRRVPGFTDDGYAAIAGETLRVYRPGEINVPAELGGTVAVGDYLKSDTDGKLVTAGSDQDDYIAIAEQDGVSGEIIPVEVRGPGQMSGT